MADRLPGAAIGDLRLDPLLLFTLVLLYDTIFFNRPLILSKAKSPGKNLLFQSREFFRSISGWSVVIGSLSRSSAIILVGG